MEKPKQYLVEKTDAHSLENDLNKAYMEGYRYLAIAKVPELLEYGEAGDLVSVLILERRSTEEPTLTPNTNPLPEKVVCKHCECSKDLHHALTLDCPHYCAIPVEKFRATKWEPEE